MTEVFLWISVLALIHTANGQNVQCENLTESTVFLMLVALLGILLLTLVALSIMVLRLRSIGKVVKPRRRKKATIRQTESNTDDEVISGGGAKSKENTPPKKEVPTSNTTVPAKPISTADAMYAEADGAVRDSTYAQPDHPDAVTNQSAQSKEKDFFKYALAKSIAAQENLEKKNETKKAYPYSKVNKSVRKKETEKKEEGGQVEPDLTIIDGNVYSPLTEGDYDHLHKKRTKVEDIQKRDNYQNISMSNESREKARTLDRKIFESHYAKPPMRSMTLKAYPHMMTRPGQETQETYDVPIKPVPIKRGSVFGSVSSMDSSNRLIVEETYDVPPSADDTYRIPPKLNKKIVDTEECYDVPPSSEDIYRLPPSSRPLTDHEDFYAVPDAEIAADNAPNAQSSPDLRRVDTTYDTPPLIPTPFQEMYNIPKPAIKSKQKIVGGLVYEDV